MIFNAKKHYPSVSRAPREGHAASRAALAAACLAAACLAAAFLSGCRVGNADIVVSQPLGGREVFSIGKSSCSLKEARLYLANYKNIYGTAYSIDLWQHDFGDDSLERYVKDVALEELTRVYCMDLLAESMEMELTAEEQAGVDEAAREYFESLPDGEAAELGIAESDLQEYYGHYAIAQKLYRSLTGEVNEEVSDDEARVMEIMQIHVKSADDAKAVSGRLRQGDDFAALANIYNDLPAIQVTVSRDDLPDAVEEAAFQLDDGEVSGLIESEDGYYFIKCLNKYDEELTEENKANIVEKRQKAAFDDVYDEFVATLDSSLNEELWDGIKLQDDASLQTNGFFSVYEECCGDGAGGMG